MIRQTLLNQIEAKNFKQNEIAKKVGISKANLSQFLDGQTESYFRNVLEIVREVYAEKEIELMTDYALNLDAPLQLKSALEYLSTNRLFEEHSQLTEKIKGLKNRSLKLFAAIHEFQMACQKDSNLRKDVSYLDKLCDFNAKEPTSKAMLTVMKGYHYYYNKDFRLANKLFNEAYKIVESLDESYIKTSLSARCLQVISYLELKVNNDINKSQEYANRLIDCDLGLSYTAYGNYVIGLSNLFTSYSEASKYFSKSIELYKYSNQVTWISEVNKKIDLLNYIHNKSNNLDTGDELALDHFIEAKNSSNKDLFYRSMIAFLKQGDSFLAQLPKFELARMGESQVVLEELQQVNQIA